MTKDDYLIEYSDIETGSIQSLIDRLDQINGKDLNELRVQDLSYHNGEPIWPGQGVYIFRKGKRILYVGKVSSMSFTERISKHFDFRSFAWMNTLLKLISKKELEHETQDHDSLKRASRYAFENLNLILINFETRDRINRTERLLRSCARPLNKFKNLTEKNFEKLLCEY
ncbi:MAG: hypothetical protein RIE86_05040 [Imperialibacter sp.]|uniref:hypothetical protein n=1 Tax=Imperialibacter sp. TaxID=2038411 RepID=UPI0032ED2186